MRLLTGIGMPKPTGERHGRAILSDTDIDLMRELYESEPRGHKLRAGRYWTLDRLAEKFEISRRQVANIVGYDQRANRFEP